MSLLATNALTASLKSLLVIREITPSVSVEESFDGLQHKGIMSIKPVFQKITKTQRSYVPLCGHTTILIPARGMTTVEKNHDILQ